ncbi:RNA ligase, DRB0094 family [Streptomyces sp. DvalAA-14]|uniref:RNA ligase (ATP) n=1 Tax=unclassified Streptomyces TaxID=2593676 RepID=UPI00081B9223|nr:MULTISPECIES: RNA ligase (ATP) [unclassified Streptomyces]MYS20130.1 RNA ligase (ATP) [Streptomyces sp. SID4948]SCD61499.1 RNA ligase, DRB0094 family [Streptomyces sp. DvalAA-14]
MSTLRVTAERLTIAEHPNADALDLAQVGLYRAVVAKGAFRTGEFGVYIPEQAVLPEELIAELGLTGRLAGSAANRVRAVRLRGELSQGIVCRPGALAGVDLARAAADGEDFAERLGIVKWVPPVPVSMSGDVEAAPELLPWTDIENLKRYPDIFAPGDLVAVSEKLHGTACCLTYCADSGATQVTSKGLGGQQLALQQAPGNLYWRAVRGHDLPAVAAELARRLGARRIGIYGEVYGRGVQDLGYGTDAGLGTPGYAAFDVCADLGGQPGWLDPAALLAGRVPLVPRLFEGPFDLPTVLDLAHGKETVSGRGLHLREGVVVRTIEDKYSPVLGGRAIAKVVSDDYLTRKGGTEYE